MATVTAAPLGGARGGPSMNTPINSGLHDPGRLQVCIINSSGNIFYHNKFDLDIANYYILQPSYSTEELNQEMANLEGLMKDLNAITASEFEC
jgi:hypothetical protein